MLAGSELMLFLISLYKHIKQFVEATFLFAHSNDSFILLSVNTNLLSINPFKITQSRIHLNAVFLYSSNNRTAFCF